MYRAAATDDVGWSGFARVGSRERSPATLFAPRILRHIARPDRRAAAGAPVGSAARAAPPQPPKWERRASTLAT